jgi:molecular chaperone GrpE (heat shock protein)
MQTRSQKSVQNQSADSSLDPTPEVFLPTQEVLEEEEEFFDALTPSEEQPVNITKTTVNIPLAVESDVTFLFSNSDPHRKPMDLAPADPSAPDTARASNPGESLLNVGSVATVAVIVRNPKDPVPTSPSKTYCASLFEKYSQPSDDQLQEITTIESKFQFPSKQKDWKALESKMSAAIEAVATDLQKANEDPTISSTTISAVLFHLFHSVLEENLEKAKTKQHSTPYTKEKTSKSTKLMKEEIASTKRELKLLEGPIRQAGKDVKNARSQKARKHNKQRRTIKKKLLEKRKQLLRILKSLNSELEFAERSLSEQTGVTGFLKNSWNFVTSFISPTLNLKSTSTLEESKSYYENLYKDPNPEKIVEDPSFMKFNPKVKKRMSDECPGFSETDWENIVKHKKSSSSPGWDGIGNSVYKNLPSMKKLLLPFFNRVLNFGDFPDQFAIADLLEIYKGKGADPGLIKSFRPICLTMSAGKILTSYLANIAKNHMISNDLFSSSQKAYLDKLSGCVEHHFALDTVLEYLKIKKGSGPKEIIMITTDISNAFGSVLFKTIDFALKKYGFGLWFRLIVKSIYSKLKVRISKDGKSVTVKQEIGVFQGDPLSSILFIIVMNISLEALDQNLSTAGVPLFPASRASRIINWITNLAFSDDVNILARSREAALKQLKVFNEFLQWSGMKGAFHKFEAVGYRKVKGKIEVFDPLLSFNGEVIKYAFAEEKFKLLGKYYFYADLRKIKQEKHVLECITTVLEKIDNMPLPPNFKLKAFDLAFASYIRWPLQIYTLRRNFVLNDLRILTNKFIRKWAKLPPGSTDSYFYLSKKNHGLGLPDIVQIWKECQITKHRILSTSRSVQTREMYQYWSKEVKIAKNQINFYSVFEEIKDSIDEFEIPSSSSKNGVSFKVKIVKRLREDNEAKHLADIREKKYQGAAFQEEQDHETAWAAAKSGISYKAQQFAQKAQINVNPTGQNKFLWFKCSPFCSICKEKTGKLTPQTLAHILGGCAIDRGMASADPMNTVTWRHNEILKVMVNALRAELDSDYKVMVDLPGHNLHYDSFPSQYLTSNSNLLPDLIILPPNDAPIIIGELTSPTLPNMKWWNATKTKKYKDELLPKMNRPASVRAFEVGHIGETNESISIFLASLGLRKKFCKSLIKQLSVIAAECSYQIFINRDNAHWTPGFAAKP